MKPSFNQKDQKLSLILINTLPILLFQTYFNIFTEIFTCINPQLAGVFSALNDFISKPNKLLIGAWSICWVSVLSINSSKERNRRDLLWLLTMLLYSSLLLLFLRYIVGQWDVKRKCSCFDVVNKTDRHFSVHLISNTNGMLLFFIFFI